MNRPTTFHSPHSASHACPSPRARSPLPRFALTLLTAASTLIGACGGTDSAAPPGTQAGASGSSSAGAAGAWGGATAGAGAGGASGSTTAGGGAAGSDSMGGAAGQGGAGTAGASGAAGSDAAGNGGEAGASGASGNGGAPGGAAGAAGALAIAPHTAPPLLTDLGGPKLHDPEIVSVTFAGDPGTQAYLDVLDFLPASDWWKSVDAEYATGTLKHLQHVELPTAAPASINMVQAATFLDGLVSQGTLPMSSASKGYVYYLFYPSTTLFTTLPGGTHCDTLAAHEATSKGHVYAVIPAACKNAASGHFLSAPAANTITHELIEVVTDPFPATAPAWQLPDDANDTFAGFGDEASDLCLDQVTKEGGYPLARFWSNKAIAAGEEPCQPYAAGEESFNVSPPSLTPIHGAPGSKIVVPLTAWSGPDVGTWKLLIQQWGGPITPGVTLDSVMVSNGQTVNLTVKVPATAKSGAWGTAVVYSVSNGAYHTWPFDIEVD